MPNTFRCVSLKAIRSILSGVLIVGLLGQVPAHADKLYPVDEAYKDTEFQAFREQLLAAARRHDAKFIATILHARISYTGHDAYEEGAEGFKKTWELDQPDSPLFDELISVFSLGGVFESSEESKEFCAPYVSINWPYPWDFENPYVAIIGQNVKLRNQPRLTATVIATLSYDIVKILGPWGDNGSKWAKVIAPTGKQGYVSRQYIRSPNDISGCFEHVNGKWLMTRFGVPD